MRLCGGQVADKFRPLPVNSISFLSCDRFLPHVCSAYMDFLCKSLIIKEKAPPMSNVGGA